MSSLGKLFKSNHSLYVFIMRLLSVFTSIPGNVLRKTDAISEIEVTETGLEPTTT